MASKKTITQKAVNTTTEADIIQETETMVIFKVKSTLTQQQHEALAERIRYENEKSGLTIILVPASIDEVEIKEAVIQ